MTENEMISLKCKCSDCGGDEMIIIQSGRRVNKKRLLSKYKELEGKKNEEEKRGNKPQAAIYNQKQKEIRSTLGILEINIKGINC